MNTKMRWMLMGLVLVQISSVIGFSLYQESILRSGTQLTLQTVPVDPRDLFRGEYIVLQYDISRLTVEGYGSETTGDYCCISERAKIGDSINIRLGQLHADETASIAPFYDWSVPIDSVADSHRVRLVVPRDKEALRDGTTNTVSLKGTIEDIQKHAGRTEYEIDYGIESFFIPEGTGGEVEAASEVKVVITVDDRGNAVIKNLIVDGVVWNSH